MAKNSTSVNNNGWGGKIEKPMDKPPKQYTANETVPADSFNESPCGISQENSGSYAKRFVGSGKR